MTEAGGLRIEAWEDGSSFPVKAHAGARRDGVGGVHDGMLKVEVTTAPEKGKANRAIVKLLAKRLAVPPGDVTLLAGDANPRKRFGVRGLGSETVAERLGLKG